jgi:LCP family protein required for cell wall assembly
MATTPPRGDSDQPDQRWTGRARVGSGEPPPVYGRKRKVRPRWGRIVLVGALVLALLTGIGALSAYVWFKNVDDDLKRTDPFSDIAGRPPKTVDGSLNILLLGSDSRDPDAPVDQAGNWRTDTIMVLHIPANHDKGYLISLPRDLWVHVPASKDGEHGDRMAKINAAYAWGGAPLMVQTVEAYTGVRMDHLVLIDFAGFIKVTDALGGVDMEVEQTVTSIFEPWRTFNAGLNHFNGDEALDYCRQRYQFPDGDFARQRHQQQFLKALLDKAASAGTLTNPGAFKDFVTASAAALTVDKDFSLFDLGWQFRSLRSDDLVFMTSPFSGTDTIDGESVVLSDKDRASALFNAVAEDTVADWVRNDQAAQSAQEEQGG